MNQQATLGDPEHNEKIVVKYLRIMLLRYHQFIVSIEALLNIATLSVDEVIVRLKAIEDDGGLPH
jgi:hypothetical protein